MIFRWDRGRSRIQKEVTSAEVMPALPAAERLTLAAIHERHADFVWRSLQRLGVRAMDLEDALQEVFLVVHRRLAEFDGNARVTTWLFAICLRVASAHRTRAHVRREQATAEVEALVPNDGRADPERDALESEARSELEALLDGLELTKRAVIVMFELEGMTTTEIAETLGIPVGTVYSRLASARAELAKAARRRRQSERRRFRP